MLSSEGCQNRRRRLWDELADPCDVLIVSDPAHLMYLANYHASPFEFRSVNSGACLVLEPRKATLVGDNLLRPSLDQAHVDEVFSPTWYEGKRSPTDRPFLLMSAAFDVALRARPERVGVESTGLGMGIIEGLRHDLPHVEWSDIRPTLLKLRRSKDLDELALMRRSIDAGEAAMAAALAEVEPGITELEAYHRIAQAAIDRLGEQAIVYGDFVSGPRTEAAGGPPTTRIIERGDLFIVDLSVVVRGYRGDFANSFVVGARPTGRQSGLYDACIDAMEAGEAALRPGAGARDVDRAVRGVLESSNPGTFTSHSGHGLGLGHPEAPFLVPESFDTIEVGDVVTLEPGQYVEGLGGMRFERNYLITPGGFETLSKHELRIDQTG